MLSPKQLVLSLVTAGVVVGTPTFISRVDDGTKFDFIVVGGGTGGTALATRLSLGFPDLSILLIEAGPYAPNEDRINIPGMGGTTFGTIYDWNHTTVPQPNLRNRVVGHPRGRVLGGSSALNLMVWDRGVRAEYEAWRELGNHGWGWDAMIEAMLRAENFTNTGSYAEGEGKGVARGGPVQTVVNRHIPRHQAENWIPTMNALGIPTNLESLGGNALGVMHQPSSVDPVTYARSYSANSYLPKAGSNLQVLTNTRVAKVDTIPYGKYRGRRIATGVSLEDGTALSACYEVILSAGTFQSPALLERSGIGSTKVLQAAGIKTLVEIPGVGENLQDHIRVQTSYQLRDDYIDTDKRRFNATFAAEQLALWRMGEASLYDYTGSGISFVTYEQSLGAETAKTLLALARESAGNSAAKQSVITRKRLALKSNPSVPQLEIIYSDGARTYPAPGTPRYGHGFFSILVGLMHPLSLGSVHIPPVPPGSSTGNSSTSIQPPVIDPHYLSTPYEAKAMTEAAKYSRRIAVSHPVRSAWTAVYEPDPKPDGVGEEEFWRDYALNVTSTIFHPAGTCAMLSREEGGVVDPALKVWGVTGLRVVDASVMPLLPSGHIQTAVYGIAEKAAAMIIEEYPQDSKGRRRSKQDPKTS